MLRVIELVLALRIMEESKEEGEFEISLDAALVQQVGDCALRRASDADRGALSHARSA
jgi:hypothetical protein